MTRAALFDRLNRELEVFGRRAQAALDEGKLQIELLRLRRQHDNAARELGLLVYRRERGLGAELGRIDALMTRLDHLKEEIERIERRAREQRGAPAERPTGAASGS